MTGNQQQDPAYNPLHDHHNSEGKLPTQAKNFLTKPRIMDILQGRREELALAT
jgi:hypothetical protein